jgi:hypothetical protein
VLHSFFAYDAAFAGGVHVAAGDVNGDGFADIVTTPGIGLAHVKVFDGRDLTELASFLAADPSAQSGANVSVGDVNGDGRADILTAVAQSLGAPTRTAPVQLFDGATFQQRASLPIPEAFLSDSLRVGMTDANGDELADLILGAGPGGAPMVRLVDGLTLEQLDEFFAQEPGFRGGLFVG